MNVHMTLQSERVSKALLTHVANECLFTCVSDHVIGQVVRLNETFLTKLAAVRTVGVVSTSVTVAVVHCCESFLTRIARIYVGTVYVLHPMSLQRIGMSKAL